LPGVPSATLAEGLIGCNLATALALIAAAAAVTSLEHPMADLDTAIPASLKAALDTEVGRTKRTLSSVVTAALSQYLGMQLHMLFQVSTSGALVAGLYDREVSVKAILEHGNFGLGTFANLDGEMVVLDGHVYQVTGSGQVSEAPADAGAPFAFVTTFQPQINVSIASVNTFKDLEAHCDNFRRSGNIFYALRLDGSFKRVRTRAVNPPQPGTRLIDAAKVQSEFNFADIEGTLVGLWSPGFSSAFSVAGYHFHFLSADPQHAGLATATTEGYPVVAIGGAVATDEALKQIHQTMDAVSILKPVTKYSVTVGAPDQVNEVMANAFRAAESGRPGAAYVNLPKDVMAAACADEPLSLPAFASLGPGNSRPAQCQPRSHGMD
jgi:acetolactate decarboxylase